MLACAREIRTVVRQPRPVYLFSQTEQSFGAHDAALLFWPGYDLGNCKSQGGCSAGEWILAGVGIIPGGKGAAVVGKGILKVSSGAARAGATNAAKLSKQLGSQEGMAELLSGGGKAIAGAGTNVPLRDVERLVSQYGGKAGDWAKVTSTAPGHLQTHAYRNVVTGEVIELKSILP